MIKAAAHLHFDGRCEDAFRFYENALGGKTTFSMTWGESPASKQVGPDWANKIIHARFEFDGQFFTADDPPPQFYTKPSGISVLLLFHDPLKAEQVFKFLSSGALVKMPFAKTFWSPGFGTLVDKFGIPWMINCEPTK